MIPFHVEPLLESGMIARTFFYKVGDEILVSIEDVRGQLTPGGKWPDVESAAAAAKSIIRGTTAEPARQEDELYEWRKYPLFTFRERTSQKWMICASKGKSMLDTGLRFDDEEKAKAILKCSRT